MYTRITAATAALLLAGSASAATLINGSFEMSSVDPGVFTTIDSPSTAIDGWTVTSGSIDYIGTYWAASQGIRSIDLAGNAIGSIAQSFDTVIGQSYTVSFDMAANPDGGTAPRNLLVSIDGGGPLIFTHPADGSLGAMNWQANSFTFVATGTSTNLAFSADDSSAGFYGATLDNVLVSVVPEPAMWAMMIGGFAVIGGAIRRRRRTAVSLA